jgi:hypothetical protein
VPRSSNAIKYNASHGWWGFAFGVRDTDIKEAGEDVGLKSTKSQSGCANKGGYDVVLRLGDIGHGTLHRCCGVMLQKYGGYLEHDAVIGRRERNASSCGSQIEVCAKFKGQRIITSRDGRPDVTTITRFNGAIDSDQPRGGGGAKSKRILPKHHRQIVRYPRAGGELLKAANDVL